eukprot:1890027-Alexandrium_andersonii.AAC.1
MATTPLISSAMATTARTRRWATAQCMSTRRWAVAQAVHSLRLDSISRYHVVVSAGLCDSQCCRATAAQNSLQSPVSI